MSTLTLDRSNEAVDQMVSAWKNGSMYQVLLRIQQIGSDPKMATFHVTEVQNETEGEETPNAEAAVEAEEAPAPTKPAVSVAYAK
jgi:hypothetical protein